MRLSHYFIPTLKEAPSDAEIISHQLMLRAGMIRKLASGLYTWLPLGFKVFKKVETIVREEMNRSGALEILMPAVQPAALWEETGRWDQFGPQLLKIIDRNEREFCFGPTHEEVITDLVRREVQSYKQLPLNLYQIQTKFRDEIRPRFGVMRAREFCMKDAYSFHLSKESLQATYDVMYKTYSQIFTRLGLNFRAVLADTGSIGGSGSHEFQVLADSGEDEIFYSDQSAYAANVELAPTIAPTSKRAAPTAEKQKVETKNCQSIDEVSQFLKTNKNKILKTLFVKGREDEIVAILLRGDHELNAVKTEKHPLIASPLQFVNESTIQKYLSCHAGYLGPIDLKKIRVIADYAVMDMSDFVCGANEDHHHFINVNWERDVALPECADLRKVVEGDPSPDGKGHLKMARGIEVGHIFQLGDKYSKSMNATVLDESGKEVVLQMGCYGIGVSRIVAAAIEQNHDQYGIIWPDTMSPFQVGLIGLNLHKSARVREACEKIYEQLTAQGLEVLWDDRDERAGVMFADMDLIGIPHHIVMSDKHCEAHTFEYKNRKTGEKKVLALNELAKIF